MLKKFFCFDAGTISYEPCFSSYFLNFFPAKTDWNKQQTSSKISKQLKPVNPAKSNIIIRTIKNPRICTKTVHASSSLAPEKEK